MSDEYTCAACGETFTKVWSDEEATAEAEQLFPNDLDDLVVVCDDCWQEMVGATPEVIQ